MSVQIETDLKEILGKIDSKLDNLQKDVTELKIGQTRLEGKVESLDEKFTNKIEGLDEKFTSKIDGLDKRLSNQEFLNRAVVVGLLLAILGGLAKLFGLTGNT
jgi:predicted nuclease with TOPRIM domain